MLITQLENLRQQIAENARAKHFDAALHQHLTNLFDELSERHRVEVPAPMPGEGMTLKQELRDLERRLIDHPELEPLVLDLREKYYASLVLSRCETTE